MPPGVGRSSSGPMVGVVASVAVVALAKDPGGRTEIVHDAPQK